MSDGKNIDATIFRLQQMIEHIKNLSIEFKGKHNEIPWGDIVGFRNGLVHEYGSTDYSTVFEVVSKDIYGLKELFEEILAKRVKTMLIFSTKCNKIVFTGAIRLFIDNETISTYIS